MNMQSFTIKESLSFAWSAYKKNWKFLLPLFIGIGILYVLVGWGSQPKSGGPAVQIIGTIFEVYLAAGIINVVLRILRDESLDIKDVFVTFDIFLKNFGAAILVMLAVMGGLILLIVPGIIWWVSFMFYSYFVVEKGMGPVESMKSSKKITQGERWHVFGFVLVMALINIIGAIPAGIGMILTIPVTSLAMAYVYKKLSGKLQITASEPAPQPAS